MLEIYEIIVLLLIYVTLWMSNNYLITISEYGVKRTRNKNFMAIFIFALLNGRYFFMIFLSASQVVISLVLIVRSRPEFQNHKI